MPDTQLVVNHRRTHWIAWGLALLCLLASLLLFLIPNNLEILKLQEAYLPIHTAIEFFAILTSFSIFTLGWATFRNVGSNKILLLGLTSFAVGWFDLGHTLSFAGMPDLVTASGPNKAIYFWIASRLTDSVGILFVALPLLSRIGISKYRYPYLLAALVWTALWFYIILFQAHHLPLMFSPATGLTDLKIIIEWVTIAIYLLAALAFFIEARRAKTEGKDLSSHVMSSACVLFATTGLLFTSYRVVDDLFNFVGHIVKSIAFAYVYYAVFQECIAKPYNRMRRIGEEAAAASEAKSRFLANVSHEFRTPLGVISGFSELFNNKQLDAEGREWIQTIQRNSDQLRFLIDDLLDLSKAETETITLRKVFFNVNEIVEDVVNGLRLIANKKNVGLELVVDEEAPHTIANDPQRFRQILLNVIGNAIKFTTKGKVIVRLSVSGTKDLKIFVEDTGIGIPSKSIPSLFRPFSQADDSFTRHFGGTGLGLALSKKLASLMGGDLWLERSIPGQGSLFVCIIRNHIDLEVDTDVSQEPFYIALPEGAPKRELSALSILVAEDSVDNQRLLQNYLRKTPFELTMVSNGKEAVSAAKERKYDLILMDIQMPEMDGVEAAKRIRANGWAGPILALTAHAHQSERSRVLQSGFNDYLVKPISKKDLIEAISKNHKGAQM